MKAEELRIGNYVYYNGKIIAVTPYAIKELYYIGDSHANSSVDKRCYKPIPLSEEILLKCRAIKFPNKIFTNTFELRLKRNKNIIISDLETPNFMVFLAEYDFENRKIEETVNVHNWDFEKNMYLHQLQNLYYALTGKELEIKQIFG
ncbi:hypothetical protein [Paenimyroides ceti]